MNKLKLNEYKTKIIEIKVNSGIEKVEPIKYLGFVIDKNLNLN